MFWKKHTKHFVNLHTAARQYGDAQKADGLNPLEVLSPLLRQMDEKLSLCIINSMTTRSNDEALSYLDKMEDKQSSKQTVP